MLRFAASAGWDGPLDGSSHAGLVGVPGDGPFVKVELLVEGGLVQAARFQTYACPAARASCAVLCWALEKKPLETCRSVTAADVALLLGGLPEGKGHLPEMAVAALREALGG